MVALAVSTVALAEPPKTGGEEHAKGAAAALMAKPPIFSRLSYENARKQADKAGKLFIVDASAEWCGPCKMMDSDTWVDATVVAWIKANAIACQIDVDERKDLSKDVLKIRAMPTVIVFRGDKELARSVGYLKPDPMMEWFEGVKAGRDFIQELRDKVDQDPTNVDLRMELAKKLTSASRYADAADQYAWLWENMLTYEPAMVGVRGSFTIAEMTDLCHQSEGARLRFVQLRDAIQKRLEGDHKTWQDLRDWIKLSIMVDDVEPILAWSDRLKDDPEGVKTLRKVRYLFAPVLLGGERWGTYGLLIDSPISAVAAAHRTAIGSMKWIPKDATKEERERYQAEYWQQFRDMAGKIHVSLLAAGRDDEAFTAANRAIEMMDDQAMRDTLVGWALKVGQLRLQHLELAGINQELREQIKRALEGK
jgi:thiol-disulfide isomerase/thioredoxin